MRMLDLWMGRAMVLTPKVQHAPATQGAELAIIGR